MKSDMQFDWDRKFALCRSNPKVPRASPSRKQLLIYVQVHCSTQLAFTLMSFHLRLAQLAVQIVSLKAA